MNSRFKLFKFVAHKRDFVIVFKLVITDVFLI